MKYAFLILVIIGSFVFMWKIGLGLNMLKDTFHLRPPIPPKPKENKVDEV